MLMIFFLTFPESSLLSTVSKNAIKMIGHRARFRDVMGPCHPIYFIPELVLITRVIHRSMLHFLTARSMVYLSNTYEKLDR